MKSVIKKIFLDLIFPRRCLGCGWEGEWLCEKCQLKLLEFNKNSSCKVCGDQLKPFHSCVNKDYQFFSLLDYHNPITAQLIAGFKYRYLTDLVDEVFVGLLTEFWQKYLSRFGSETIIIPIPIHFKKKLKRGFNQSEMIAEKLAKISGLKLADGLLTRTVNNKPQAGSGNIASRRKNTTGIFRINYRQLSRYHGRSILLIDDVYTTGCTLEEAIKTLKIVGFSDIYVLVLALN